VIKRGAQWALSTADTFDEPVLPAPLSGGKIEPDGRGIGSVMHNLSRHDVDQHAAAVHQVLVSVRATNRVDDWQRLLVMPPSQ
jgi:hypothetical protein